VKARDTGAMIILAALLAAAAPATVASVEKDAPPSAWRAIPPENLMLIDTPRGNVVIELAPGFAPQHVAAIRALVEAHRFDGGAIIRVQDNYVVQWAIKGSDGKPGTGPALAAEYERPAQGQAFTPLPYPDPYGRAGFSNGWPVATQGGKQWLTHCYAMVGVGRDMAPDNGDGSELYAVIGHAPRHLDRNIALVGRVIENIEAWSGLPRGSEAMGFYKTDGEKVALTSVRLASDLPPASRPRFEVMDTGSASFRALIEARANRREAFFNRPAGGVDVCNVKIPVRRLP
jgi:peptidylprolyl isomerase